MSMRQRQTEKKVYPPSKHRFKRRLVKSGYSNDATDRIWKWYHPKLEEWDRVSSKPA